MNTTSRRVAEVERYIHELAIALAGLPVEEREDVIAGVREHIDDALLAIDDPSVADVQRILEDLGDPLAIAADAEARTSRPESSARTWNAGTGEVSPDSAAEARPYPPGFDQPPPLLQRTWIPAATILAFPVAALLLWVGGPGVAAPAAAMWMVGVVVLLASPLWSGVEKFVGATVLVGLPAALVLVRAWAYMWGFGVGLPLFQRGPGFARDIGNFSYYGGAWLVAGLVLAIFVAAGAWLLARGSARAHKPSPEGAKRV
jgi:hypothetical protein